jgi:hypothetical protein
VQSDQKGNRLPFNIKRYLSPFSKWTKGTGAGALQANSVKLELIACGIPITLDNLLKGIQ